MTHKEHALKFDIWLKRHASCRKKIYQQFDVCKIPESGCCMDHIDAASHGVLYTRVNQIVYDAPCLFLVVGARIGSSCAPL